MYSTFLNCFCLTDPLYWFSYVLIPYLILSCRSSHAATPILFSWARCVIPHVSLACNIVDLTPNVYNLPFISTAYILIIQHATQFSPVWPTTLNFMIYIYLHSTTFLHFWFQDPKHLSTVDFQFYFITNHHVSHGSHCENVKYVRHFSYNFKPWWVICL